MRLILALWFFPLALFWGWYALSVNDIHFGYAILSRDVHDIVFELYAQTIGVDRALLPGIIAGACILDSAIILAIAAFRWRKSWVPQAREMLASYWRDDPAGSREEEEFALALKAGPSARAHPAE